jgi:hypothetical protein
MFKKLTAILLSITMVFTLSVSAAAETPSKEDLPKIIGTDKMWGLGAIVRSFLKGTSVNSEISFTNRYYSSDSAINAFRDEEGDILFYGPLSNDERDHLWWGNDNILGSEKIAVEGLVFFVNPENPVKELSSAEIRGIYSGKITNWKEVGGDDVPITAFQRFEESNSYELMKKFMFSAPLMKPPVSLSPVEMIGTAGFVAAYDNAKYSIGYSVYSYPVKLQERAGNIDFVAVDGVKPTHMSFTDSSYPYSEAIYAYYRTDKEIPAVQKTLDYLKSDRGQLAVLEAGFMPVTNIAIPSKYKVYQAVGTGKTKPENYEAMPYISYYDAPFRYDYKSLIDAISDENLKKEIYEFIDLYDDENDRGNPDVEAINGYLSVSCSGGKLLLDMFTGERIEKLTDMFYKDADFVPALNERFDFNWAFFDEPPQKCDYVGLLDEPRFDLEYFSLPYENSYYYDSKKGNHYSFSSDSLLDLMPLYEYRDMSECFVPEFRRHIVKKDLPYYTDASYAEGDRFYFAVNSRYGDTTEINKELRKACDTVYALDLTPESTYDFADIWSYEILDNCFQIYGGGGKSIFIDRKSGKALTLSDVFKKGFVEKMAAKYPDAPKSDFTDAITFYVYAYDDKITICTSGESYNYSKSYETDIADLKSKYADIPEKAVSPP